MRGIVDEVQLVLRPYYVLRILHVHVWGYLYTH